MEYAKPSGESAHPPSEPTVLPSDDRHRLRSKLQTVRVGLSLIEKLIDLGRHEEAQQTCEKIIGSVEILADDPSLNPPG